MTAAKDKDEEEERQQVNEQARPEDKDDFKFENMFEYRDGTRVDFKHIPDHRPKDWKEPKYKKDVPLFADVDNPKSQDPFVFT